MSRRSLPITTVAPGALVTTSLTPRGIDRIGSAVPRSR